MTAVFVIMIDKLLTAQWEVHNGRHHGRPFAGSAYIGGGGKIFEWACLGNTKKNY